MVFNYIFSEVIGMDYELLKRMNILREVIEKNQRENKNKSNTSLADELFEYKTMNCISGIIEILDSEDYSREKLELLEKDETTKSMSFFDQYKNREARGKLIGTLNKGFYTKTNKELVNYIRANTGSCNTKYRLVNYMSDEILKYRIAMLKIAKVYSKKSKEEGKDYRYISNRMFLLGQIAREMFVYDYNEVPEDTLVKIKNKQKTNK